MSVTGFLGSGLAREQRDERWLAFHEQVERGMDGVEIFKGVHPVGADAELAGSLRAAQEQDAEDGNFVAMKIEQLIDAMLVLGHAGIAAGGANQGLV